RCKKLGIIVNDIPIEYNKLGWENGMVIIDLSDNGVKVFFVGSVRLAIMTIGSHGKPEYHVSRAGLKRSGPGMTIPDHHSPHSKISYKIPSVHAIINYL